MLIGKPRLSHLSTSIFFLSYLSICGRGVAELFLNKSTGYALQLVLWSIFIALYFLRPTKLLCFTINKNSILATSFFLLFLFSEVISGYLTSVYTGFHLFWVYSLVFSYLATLLLISSTISPHRFLRIHVAGSIAWILVIITAFALIEQLGFVSMPGSAMHGEFVRPASIFGSKQHYSIVVAILTVICYQIFVATKSRVYYYITIIGFISTITSLTRSGVLILLLSLVFYYIQKPRKPAINRKLIYPLMLSAILILLLLFYEDGIFMGRLITMFSIESPGNSDRLDAWIRGIVRWSESPLLFGKDTGLATNITTRLTSVETIHYESGIIQHLVNFGLIGLLSYYALMLSLLIGVNKCHLWLRALIPATILQTVVYHSTESFPFMVTLTLIPVVSYWLMHSKKLYIDGCYHDNNKQIT